MSNAPALKLNVFIAHPSYGGNGGISSEHPDIREWALQTVPKMKADPRIGEVYTKTVADTPITMVRNHFVRLARAAGAHVLLMVDSDQSPNKHAGESWHKPFWDVAFDALYEHYGKGPLVLGAPYCGPPGAGENVYVFQFDNLGAYGDEAGIRLDQFTRAEAEKMSGITEVAALPTGMILFDLRIFDLCEPSSLNHEQILDRYSSGKMSRAEALHALSGSWFHYEWNDCYEDEKASTEDVAATRDMGLICAAKLGYNPLRCCWDSWIGHHKPWNVGKPKTYSVENISGSFRKVIEEDRRKDERVVDFQADLEGAVPAAKIPKGEEHKGNGKPAEDTGLTWDQLRTPTGYRTPTFEELHPNHPWVQPPPVIKKHFWQPWPTALRQAEHLADDAANRNGLVVEIGPGKRPFRPANHYVGWRDPSVPDIAYGDGHFEEINLEADPLPFADGDVDFLYCRHVIEDLSNPLLLLEEIQRVAQAGWIEVPSALAETCRGVDAPGIGYRGRGYAHHRNILCVQDSKLVLLPKLPYLDQMALDERADLLNQSHEYWNTYYVWGGPLGGMQFEVLRHEADFTLTSYRSMVIEFMRLAKEDCERKTKALTQAFDIDSIIAPPPEPEAKFDETFDPDE